MLELLNNNVLKASVWSGLQRFGSLGIGFITNMVLARLLCPEDFGCIGLILVFVSFADVLVDGGLGSALIFKKYPTDKDYSTVFSVNLFISFILYTGIFFFSPAISTYVNVPGLTKYLRVEAIAIFLRAFYAIPAAYLSKNLKFKYMAIMGIISASLSAIVSILMAAKGCGIWSLVAKNLILNLCTMALYIKAAKLSIRIGFSFSSFKELFGYGWFVALTSFMDLLYSNLVSFIIGKRYSVKDLGYYNQAYSLQQIPTYSLSMVINQVLFPFMSKMQDDMDRIRNNAKKTLSVTTFVVFPVLIFFIFFGKQIIILIYSAKWIPSAVYFQILLVGGLVNCMIHINRNILKSVGKTQTLFRTQIIITLLSIIAVFISIRYDIKVLVCSVVLCSYINWIMIGIITGKSIGYSFLHQLNDILGSLVISSVSGLLAYIISVIILNMGTVLTLLLSMTIFALCYIGLNLLFKTKSMHLIVDLATHKN